jgi:ribosomal-protein-alanine N-acetyltransferase
MLHGGMLEGPRIAIRPFDTQDIGPLVELLSDPDVFRFVGDGVPLSVEDAARWVARSRENLERFGYGTGAVVSRETGKLMGWAGFARPGDGSEELIYGLAREHWRQGYGQEVLAILIGFASRSGLEPLRATVHPENVVSARLLIKAGFHLAACNYKSEEHSDLYLKTTALR